jgi:hypothetical protein
MFHKVTTDTVRCFCSSRYLLVIHHTVSIKSTILHHADPATITKSSSENDQYDTQALQAIVEEYRKYLPPAISDAVEFEGVTVEGNPPSQQQQQPESQDTNIVTDVNDNVNMHEPLVNDYREEEILKISGNEALKFGTPQRLARDWIMLHDNVDVYSKNGMTTIDADDPRFIPRYIMAVLYFSLKGNLWSRVEGWLGDQDICFWPGVCCLDSDYSDIKHCTTDNTGPEPKRIELKLSKLIRERSCSACLTHSFMLAAWCVAFYIAKSHM